MGFHVSLGECKWLGVQGLRGLRVLGVKWVFFVREFRALAL